MRIVLLAPTYKSLYSRMVTYLVIQESGMDIVGVVVRTIWSLKRLRGEIRRDGVRLLQKIRTKLLLSERIQDSAVRKTLAEKARQVKLPGSDLKDIASLYQLPVYTVADHNTPRAESIIHSLAPDVIVFTGGGLIRKRILEIPRLGVLNCHAGILPRYRGMDVVEWPLIERDSPDSEIGITLHFMDRGVDTGPILLHKPMKIQKGDTFEEIRARIEPMMVDLVLTGLRGLRDNTVQVEQQEKSAGKQYFVMHPRLKQIAAQKLSAFTNQM